MKLDDKPLTGSSTFEGNILLFYAYDLGDDIDLEMIQERGLIPTHIVPLSAYFKNYHTPLSFYVEDENVGEQVEQGPHVTLADFVISKIHPFGAISFCYRIPFKSSLEELKGKLIEVTHVIDKKNELHAHKVYEKIKDAVKQPHFYNLKNSYFAIQVNPDPEKIHPEEFKENYGNKIASLLRLETKTLSEYQKDEILSSTTGYYGQDLIIIDGEGAFIYDDEYFEPMEFFESALVQQLELQYYDRLLDEQLTYYYKQQTFKIPLSSYIPLMGGRFQSPINTIAKLRVDVSVVTERLGSSIKMVGDTYYSKVYSMLTEKLSLREWYDSIQKKLDIMQDLYELHQDRLDVIHGELMEMVIIILIAMEIVLAFWFRH